MVGNGEHDWARLPLQRPALLQHKGIGNDSQRVLFISVALFFTVRASVRRRQRQRPSRKLQSPSKKESSRVVGIGRAATATAHCVPLTLARRRERKGDRSILKNVPIGLVLCCCCCWGRWRRQRRVLAGKECQRQRNCVRICIDRGPEIYGRRARRLVAAAAHAVSDDSWWCRGWLVHGG